MVQQNEIFSTSLTAKRNVIKIHAIQTELICVKKQFPQKKGSGAVSKINVVLGSSYDAFMPICSWVVEHPEGIFIIYTGDIEAGHDNVSIKKKTCSQNLIFGQCPIKETSREKMNWTTNCED